MGTQTKKQNNNGVPSNVVPRNASVPETLSFLKTEQEKREQLFKEITTKIKRPKGVVSLPPKEERDKFWQELKRYVKQIEEVGIATEIRAYYRISRKEWQIRFHNKAVDYAVADAVRMLFSLKREDIPNLSRESQIKLLKALEHLETILR